MSRIKKLTDYTYSPTNPASEDAIRLQIDDSIQEVYDAAAKNTDTVNLTGTQTVGGVKSFTNGVKVPVATDVDNPIRKDTFETHKTSSDHDERYFTEAEVNALLLANQQGNHLGTWQGYSPTATSPGIQSVVDSHTIKISNFLHINNYPVVIPEIDDTERFKRMLLDATNKIVILGGETYTISDTLYLPLGCKIVGNGSILINNITTSVPVFWIQNSNCSIDNLTVQNTDLNVGINGATTQAYYGSAIVVGYQLNVVQIENTNIVNVTVLRGIDQVAAIVLVGAVKNCTVKNCTVDGSGAPTGTGFVSSFHVEWNGTTVLSPSNIKFENCTARNMTRASTNAFYISGSYNVEINNCLIETVRSGIYLYSGDKGVEAGKNFNCILKNSTIIDFDGYAIQIKGEISIGSIPQKMILEIDNNYIKGKPITASSITRGVRIYSSDSGIKITNNTFERIFEGIVGNPFTGCLIDNNVFNDIYGNVISMTGLTKSILSNNTFREVCLGRTVSETTYSPMYLSFATNDNTIIGNMFEYSGQSTVHRTAIKFVANTPESNYSIRNKVYFNTFHPTIDGPVLNISYDATNVNYVDHNVEVT